MMKYILTILVISGLAAGATVIVAKQYAANEGERIASIVDGELQQQRQAIADLATLLVRDSVDQATQDIIVECSLSNRMRFDDLLNGLATLSEVELQETKKLFDGCARVFSARKLLMSDRLQREFEVYQNLVTLNQSIDETRTNEDYQVDDLEMLVSLEKNRSQNYQDLTNIQLQIIAKLEAGESADSETILELTQEANNKKEEIGILSIQTKTLIEALQL